MTLLCAKAISGLCALILSEPSLNLHSYPFGLPRSEHKFFTARLFDIKVRPVLETVSIPLLKSFPASNSVFARGPPVGGDTPKDLMSGDSGYGLEKKDHSRLFG